MSGHHTVPPPPPVSCHNSVSHIPATDQACKRGFMMLYNILRRCQLTGSVLILKVKYNIKALYKEKTLVYMSAYHPPPWCSCSSPPMMMFDGAGDSTDYLGAVQYSTVQYSTVQYSTGLVIAQIISVQCLSLFPSRPGAVRGPGCHGTGTFVAMNTEHIVTSGILVEADTAKHDS